MISFALPWALIGLVAAALPLLLHLIQRHDAPEVSFPAVRYLEDATRDQQKRLRFHHLLLLLLRTLLIIAVVLAAAGPTVRRRRFGPHAPGALVLVVDNSAASGAVIDGEPLLAQLVRAAGRVLDHASIGDRIWVVAADRAVHAGTVAESRTQVASLVTEPVRLDLGWAITTGRELIRASGRDGEVVVVSAVQRSAVAAANGDGALLVLRPTAAPPANRSLLALAAGLQPWGPAGGRVTISVASNDTTPVPVTLSLGGRLVREVLVTPGVPSQQRLPAPPTGWGVLTAALPPDEFRLDDAQSIPLRSIPAPAVEWDAGDRYVAAAATVLAADGRIRAGAGMHLGTLGPGPSIVMPPEDPARAAAINRALTARGVTWQFGTVVAGSERTDSGALLPSREAVSRRFTLEHRGNDGEVLATVNGAAWLVRSGDVLLLGSRLDPAWTGLPLAAAFVPFLDAVLTGAARGELVSSDITAGESIRLPERVSAVAHDGVVTPVAGASPWTARTTGVFLLLAGADTLGAIAVRIDPRAAALARATDPEIRAIWRGATVAGLTDGPALAFMTGSRGDLRGLLLVIALCCAVAEAVLAKGASP